MSACASDKTDDKADNSQLGDSSGNVQHDTASSNVQTAFVKLDDSINSTSSSDLEEDGCAISEKPTVPVFECPVCLQIASFPVKLPCTHIFCFLCVKGFANRSKRCALCRQEIPADFFNDPKLLCREEIKEKSKASYDEGYQWFYEGRNGWWQYDDRTSIELEKRFKEDDKVFELLIAGFLYVIDLENMRQFRRNDQTRRRRIKRDMQNIPGVKGIAGLKFNENQPRRPNGDGESSQTGASGNSNTVMSVPLATNQSSVGILPSVVNDNGTTPSDDSYLTPPAPNNTPQTPMTPADSQPSSLTNSTEDLSLQMNMMNLRQGSPRNPPSLDGNQDDNDTPDSSEDTVGRETCL